MCMVGVVVLIVPSFLLISLFFRLKFLFFYFADLLSN
jgi:hypothetical protein